MSQCDAVIELKINIGHNDVYIKIQWFCSIYVIQIVRLKSEFGPFHRIWLIPIDFSNLTEFSDHPTTNFMIKWT